MSAQRPRGLDDGARIVDEEQFGPALPVVAYDDVNDALRRANNTQFGLNGSVWSADPERAAVVAEQLECGTSWINTHAIPSPAAPFGGRRVERARRRGRPAGPAVIHRDQGNARGERIAGDGPREE